MNKTKDPIPLNMAKSTINLKNKDLEVHLMTKKPNSLYKYYAFNKNSLCSLENETFHFSHVNLLNDIMDGNFPIKWDLNEFIGELIKDKKLEVNESNREYLKRVTAIELNTKTLQYLGVFSICDKLENELLWIHYTNEKGYALELDYELFKNNLSDNYRNISFPITYNKIEKINFYDYCHKEIDEKEGKVHIDYNLAIIACLAEKEQFWRYENEWRFVLWNENFNNLSKPTEIISEAQRKNEIERLSSRNIKINTDIIKKIILGCHFFNNYRFNQIELSDKIDNNIILFYYFNNEKELTLRFFKKLKEKYNDKIFQIDKVVENNLVKRKITKKIEIIDVFESSVKIKVSQIM